VAGGWSHRATASLYGGLAAFVAVCCRFTDIEALALHATGHERVVLRLDGPAATREILAP
jgi:hypothetical protein